jgi:thiamine pyrophosphokinase
MGALGIVRPEHAIANLLLLADPRLDGADVAIVARGSRIWRIGTADGPGEAAIGGASGDFVSLFPMAGGVDGVTTDGLRFPLRDEALPPGPSRGLSNELLGASAIVRTRRGRLLVVHTARAQADGHGQAGS